ncbi:MAG: site-2 protease family protein, partial [Coriobacteriia bacterium]|nr:site-2 protease family protein [Coriobacteriia bacterium]
MFGLPSLRIGKIFGIPVEVNTSWFIIFALVATSLSFSYYPAVFGWPPAVSIASGVITTLLFFASVVAHEMSHSLVARAGGLRINKVTLFLFGGVAEMAEEPHGPGREFAMAVAGPAMSLLLAGLFFFGYVVLAVAGASDIIWGPARYLGMINLFVAMFNLLPGFPLDGGRVFRSFVWAVTGDLLKATLWATRAGQVIGFSMVGGAAIGVFNGRLDFAWLGLMGFFLTILSESAYRQQLAKSRLASVTVADIMTPSPLVVPGEVTLEQLAHDYFLGGRHSRYPVL